MLTGTEGGPRSGAKPLDTCPVATVFCMREHIAAPLAATLPGGPPRGVRALIATAIITCDREQFGKPNYFPRMWHSFVASGTLDFVTAQKWPLAIFDAGPGGRRFTKEVKAMTGQRVYSMVDERIRLDVVRNDHRAMAWAAGTGCEYALLLEDDVVFSRHFLQQAAAWLRHAAPQDGMLYSLLTFYPFVRKTHEAGRTWCRYSPDHFYGSQAVLLPRSTLLSYLLSDERQEAEQRGCAVDIWLGKHIAACACPVYAHCPSLAMHIGFESLVASRWHDSEEKAAAAVCFLGEQYDALGGTP